MGGHRDQPTYNPVIHHLTRVNSRVFLMMYLSTFMFSGEHTVEVEGSYTIIRLAATFRRALEIGEYPYPFWHAASKWTAYLDATEVLIVMKAGQVAAIYRFGSDATQPRVTHTWDGRWTWDDGGITEPRVALFTYVLSPTNPHLEDLNGAYRALESKFRDQTCTECHAPDNSDEMTPLILLTYPNQALGERHRLIDVLEANDMPPEEGVADPHREEILALAREFARIGDDALAHEGEPIV